MKFTLETKIFCNRNLALMRHHTGPYFKSFSFFFSRTVWLLIIALEKIRNTHFLNVRNKPWRHKRHHNYKNSFSAWKRLLLSVKHIFGFHKIQIWFFTLKLKNENEKYLRSREILKNLENLEKEKDWYILIKISE